MSEDSMRCRRAPELTFGTGDELERHRAALDVAFKALNMVATATDVSLTAVNACAETALSRIADLFPPEFEEVEVVRWMAEDGRVFVVEEAADLHQSTLTCGEVVKLTGTVKRPVRRAVIREYEVAAVITKGHPILLDGAIIHTRTEETKGPIFADHPECHGKAGVLIFRTAE